MHTPGEWTFTPSGAIMSYDGDHIANVFLVANGDVIYNGHLLAASKNLLAACQAFVTEVESPDFEMTTGEREAYELAKAAIDKAKGE